MSLHDEGTTPSEPKNTGSRGKCSAQRRRSDLLEARTLILNTLYSVKKRIENSRWPMKETQMSRTITRVLNWMPLGRMCLP